MVMLTYATLADISTPSFAPRNTSMTPLAFCKRTVLAPTATAPPAPLIGSFEMSGAAIERERRLPPLALIDRSRHLP